MSYEFEDGSTRMITLDGDQLYSQRSGGGKYKLLADKNETFWFENSLANLKFTLNGEEVSAEFNRRRDNTTGKKTDKPLPTYNEISLDESIMKRYVGVYEIQPGFEITITLEDGKLMSQATGQQKFQIFPETETKYFLKVVDSQLEFQKNDAGEYDSFMLYQGGQEIAGKKKD